jgi:hypothetical protein
VMHLRPSLCWDVRWCQFVVGYQGLGQPISPKTSLMNYQPMLHNVSEEQRSEPNISVHRPVSKTESMDILSTNKM